ncbi:hypothetical protein AK88_02054 [Plasmodium fragile]|uniref:Uncharacterized protein n=1 Tax=Plasmodium fragile TaxID=5857 RepID=A0A0D9QMX1_PLAFR|nr:uncharacterized protein AK88_02054 [Plasmodium fragile]KJP88273.1 hypothetical protein AK88_02054 [Plasmodium fragile]
MDLFEISSEKSSCQRMGREHQGRGGSGTAVRGRLIKPERSSEEREELTNLFSTSSGEDNNGTKEHQHRASGRKRGFFSDSVNGGDSAEEDRRKNKKRRVKSKCLFSTISDEDAGHKSAQQNELGDNCLFSSDVEKVNDRGDNCPQERNSNCLFSSSSEQATQCESDVKGKNESHNGEGANLQSTMHIRDGNFYLNVRDKGINKTRKKTSSCSKFALGRRSRIANRGARLPGRSGKRETTYYDLHDTTEEGMYRLINFAKLKRRATRKLNFMSILNMTNEGGESSGSSCGSLSRARCSSPSSSSSLSSIRSRGGAHAGDGTTESTANSEEDILNRTGVSYAALSESTQESIKDSAALNDEGNNNRTMNVYNYYYLGSHMDKLVLHKDVEKIKDSGNCVEGDNLHDRLFGLRDENQKRLDGVEVTSDGMHKVMSKEETTYRHKGKSFKMTKPRNKMEKRNNLMVERNLRLYRNFKNINVEVTRQNNLKGLNLKKIVVNFIRLVNKNMVLMRGQGQMDASQEGNYSGEKFKDTSDVEEWYVSKRGGDVTKGEEAQTEPLLQEERQHPSQLELAKCVCIFCSEKKKILTNEEMHISTFNYMDERKKEDTVIKPFFMHNYVFTAFMNYFIHYGKVARVQRGGENLHLYKFEKKITKKYGIKRVIIFVAKKVTLTTVGIHMEGSNMLQEDEEFVLFINFFKWSIIRRRYEEIVKLKRRKKEKESLSIFKTFFFFVKAIDEYCSICNIQVDHPNGKKKNFEKKKKFMSQPFCKREDNTHSNGTNSFGFSYSSHNEVRIQQIEDALNRDLINSRLMFALVDSLRISVGRTLYLFPAHMLVLV